MPKVLGSKDGLLIIPSISMRLINLVISGAIDNDFPIYENNKKEIITGCNLQLLLEAIKKDIPEVDIAKLKETDIVRGTDSIVEIINTLIINESTPFNDNLITKVIAFFYKHIYDTKKAFVNKNLIAFLIPLHDKGKTKEDFRRWINEQFSKSNIEYYLTKKGSFIILPFNERTTTMGPEIINIIHETFELNVPIPKEEIRTKIQQIFDNFHIDEEATQKTVEKYFKASPSNYKKPSVYRLKEYLN